MNEGEIKYQGNLDAVLSKIENGNERFNTSPHLRMAVEQLVRGADPVQVIDQLCTSIDTMNGMLERLSKHAASLVGLIESDKKK